MQGCYQKDDLPAVQQTLQTETKSDTTLSLDEEVEAPSEETETDEEGDDQASTDTPVVVEKSLEDLLDIFFGTFVLPINKVNEPFDTRVDYERLHDLRIKKDETYVRLVTKIERKFRAKDALKEKSDNYKKAFYINAYNYFAIRLINRFYINKGKRIESILDLSEGPLPHQIFDARFIRVHGEDLVSLNTVEKTLLSAITGDKDGRTHFAVICVSKGCPITLNRAYREETLEDQLNEITKASLKLPRMLKNDNDDKKTYLTKIFDWYEDDFAADKGSVKAFIEHHGGQVLHDIKFSKYDWTLNGLTEQAAPVIDKPELPSEDGGEGSGAGEEKEHPCKALLVSEDERIVSLCSNLISGRESKISKYTVTEAKLCIIRNSAEDKYAIRGELTSKDKKEVESLIEVDFSGKAKVTDDGFFEWDHKDSIRHEASYNPEEQTLKFRQNTKGVRRSIRKIVVGCE